MPSTSPVSVRARRNALAAALLATACVLAACGGTSAARSGSTEGTDQQRPASATSPTVTLDSPQPAGSTVKVDRVDLPQPGTTSADGGIVAVCADAGGRAGTCDGYAPIPDGTSLDIVIPTASPLVPGPYIVGVYYAHGLPSGDRQPLAQATVQLS